MASEQRIASGSSQQPHRRTRPPSVASLRHQQQQQQQQSQGRRQGHSSRRQSTDESAQPQPPSPITYFPNPSSFTQSPNQQYMPSLSTSPSASSSRLPGSISHSSSASSAEDEVGDNDPGSMTPRVGPVADTFATSPHASILSTTNGGNGGRRRSSGYAMTPGGVRAMSSAGYGTMSSSGSFPTTEGLGFGGNIETRRAASSAGIAIPAPITAPVRSETGMLSLPGHGAYYASQPPSASSRFRDKDHGNNPSDRDVSGSYAPPSAFSSQLLGGSTSSHPLHRRHLSVNSTLSHVAPPLSPGGSMLQRIKKTASAVGLGLGRADAYDRDEPPEEDEEEPEEVDEGKRANGTRVWYSSYVTIDWIHDSIKESSRIRRLRHNARRSITGSIVNSWDRFQGWLIVTIVGVLTAMMAFAIIRSEMALFDLKEGFCSTSWLSAKRFCCAPRHGHGRPDPSSGDEDMCGDWIEWGEFFEPNQKGGAKGAWAFNAPEFIAYFVIALALATLASTLTVYLTSTANHVTSKDSKFLAPPAESSAMTSPTKSPNERQPLLDGPPIPAFEEMIAEAEPPRPVLYMAGGSGIPEIKTILSGFVIHGYLGMSTLLVKSTGLALSVASGLSLGKEGPFVHIASCIANIVSRMFLKYELNEAKRREVLSAACAAGVAVSFGAPIGGVLFSLEEVSYYFPPKVMWRSFWCAAVAAIALKALNPYGNGSIVLFAVTYTKEYHYWEYGIFLVLGIFGGMYGALFSRLNIIWSREVRRGTWLNRHPIVEVALVTSLTTIVSFMNPYTRLGGTELVAKLFAECHADTPNSVCVSHPSEIASVMYTIGIALLIKGALTIITFGIKLPAGIFIPSLVVGACFGRIVGLGMEWLEFVHPRWGIFDVCRDSLCVVPGLYAMVGAAATLAGVTRTTVSLAVIMFELTGTLNYVVPVMLAVLVAKTVADALEKKGIYELVIDLNKLPYLNSKEEYLWGGKRVSEVADKDVPTLRADKPHTVRELTGRLLELVRLGFSDTGFPVLVKEPTMEKGGRQYGCLRIVGFLGINELEHALSRLSDEPDAMLNLIPDDNTSRPRSSVLSIFSFADSIENARHNPYDLSRYIDRAPITVQIFSPLELVQQLFVRLGARQILVTDSRGAFKGVVYKKPWLAFLNELNEGHGR